MVTESPQRFLNTMVAAEVVPLWDYYRSRVNPGFWCLMLDAWDCTRLYRLVRDCPINHILELGTGSGLGTAVMAQALYDAHRSGQVETMEEYYGLAQSAARRLPQHLRPLVLGRTVSAGVMDTLNGIPVYGYQAPPVTPEIDLLVIDGPCVTQDELHRGAVKGDLLWLLARLRPGGLVYFDGNRDTQHWLLPQLPQLHLLEHSANYSLLEKEGS